MTILQEAHGVGRAVGIAVLAPGQIVFSAVRGLLRMLTRVERAEVTGPVGITKEVNRAAESGLVPALRLVGALGAFFFPLFALASILVVVFGRRSKT